MKYTSVVIFFVLLSNIGFCQSDYPVNNTINKGRLYFYWGWNWGWYSNSDINFSGEDYDFTLEKVVAKDRQSEISINTYLNPANMTIPQYNFRVGYYVKENWDVSFGIDHMKYVVEQNQTAVINGYIYTSNSEYEGIYNDENIVITEDFLKFEHTDGLNYVNTEVRHSDEIFEFGKINISLKEGLGVGLLVPRTNTTLLSKERYDEFHLAGYGVDGVIGLNVSFFNKFFVQTDFKGGYINMPDIRTTSSKADSASQHFFFTQFNLVFGGKINLSHKAKAHKG